MKAKQQKDIVLRDASGFSVSKLRLAGIDNSLDPVESMMMHRYCPTSSCLAFVKYNTLVTLPSELPDSVEAGKPALEISAVVPQTNDKGSVPLAVQVSSMSSPG